MIKLIVCVCDLCWLGCMIFCFGLTHSCLVLGLRGGCVFDVMFCVLCRFQVCCIWFPGFALLILFCLFCELAGLLYLLYCCYFVSLCCLNCDFGFLRGGVVDCVYCSCDVCGFDVFGFPVYCSLAFPVWIC